MNIKEVIEDLLTIKYKTVSLPSESIFNNQKTVVEYYEITKLIDKYRKLLN